MTAPLAPLTQGANMVLPHGLLTVRIKHHACVQTDMVALLLNSEGKVRSDDDLIFFNNPAGQGVRWSEPSIEGNYQHHSIQIDPTQWAAGSGITKAVVALTIDEDNCKGKSFGNVQELQVEIFDNSNNLVTTLDLGRPTVETGFLVAQVYLHNGTPKLRCVAEGYTTGLTGIVTDHGIEVADEEPSVQAAQPVVQDSQPVPDMTKPKLGSGAVYDLSKAPTNGSVIDMRKHQVATILVKNAIDGIVARVVLVIDSSGSMEWHNPPLFSGGVIQRSLERVVPIADMLDDNHKMEVYFFGTHSIPSQEVSLSNMENYITRNWDDKVSAGGSNNEPEVMQDIKDWVEENPSEYPTLVLFWSDGGIYMDMEIERLIRDSLELPIFWMFLGLGRADYGILRNLDTLENRFIGRFEVDNTGFEEIDDIETKEDTWLYDIIFSNMAKWVREMIAAGKLDAYGRVVR